MSKTIERKLEDQLETERYIISVLDDAAYAERFLAKPNNNRCPTMYKLLETYYDKADWGFHEKPKLTIRATPRQMTRYDLAIDILLLIDDDVSDNPTQDRKMFWLKANRFGWSKLGRLFAYHRTTIKRRYENVLDKLAKKFKKHLTNKTVLS